MVILKWPIFCQSYLWSKKKPRAFVYNTCKTNKKQHQINLDTVLLVYIQTIQTTTPNGFTKKLPDKFTCNVIYTNNSRQYHRTDILRFRYYVTFIYMNNPEQKHRTGILKTTLDNGFT